MPFLVAKLAWLPFPRSNKLLYIFHLKRNENHTDISLDRQENAAVLQRQDIGKVVRSEKNGRRELEF